jgi:hypothetical protein
MTQSQAIIIKTEYAYDFLNSKKCEIEKGIVDQLSFYITVKVVLVHKNNPSNFKIVVWTTGRSLNSDAILEKLTKIIQACLGDRILSIRLHI